MSESEFGEQAAEIADRITDLAPDDRIAAACRGSGNPVALAWLAENLRLSSSSRVADLGAGLGGPSAWMQSRYGCTVFAVEPQQRAATAAVDLFGGPMVVSDADPTPFVDDAFDVALLLGVVSVVDDPRAVLREAHRIADALGLIEYCSTGDNPVLAGGSTFPTVDALTAMVSDSWTIDQTSAVSVETPSSWAHASEVVHDDSASDPDEEEVGRAIAEGRIAPIMLVATR